jgi:hypothetical protein
VLGGSRTMEHVEGRSQVSCIRHPTIWKGALSQI